MAVGSRHPRRAHGLPKYPILRYVSDGADAPPPPNYVREQPMGFAPVRENDEVIAEELRGRGRDDGVRLRVRRLIDEARAARAVLWCVVHLAVSRSCRDVSFAGQSFALADATVKNGTTEKELPSLSSGIRHTPSRRLMVRRAKLVVRALVVERAVSHFFTSDEFRVRRARRRRLLRAIQQQVN